MFSPRRVMSGVIGLSWFIMFYQQIQLMYNDGGVWFLDSLQLPSWSRKDHNEKGVSWSPYFLLGLNFKLGDIIHLLC